MSFVSVVLIVVLLEGAIPAMISLRIARERDLDVTRTVVLCMFLGWVGLALVLMDRLPWVRRRPVG
jgi:hypothetical protein